MKRGYWTLAFASGLYDLFSPRNYTDALTGAVNTAELLPGEHVLDAGSGMGSIIPLVADWLRRGGRIVCMDVDEKGLAATARRAAEIGVNDAVEVRQHDFTHETSFSQGEFNAVFCLFALYAIGDDGARRRALRNFYTCLKHDGRIIVIVPNTKYNAESILRDARRRFEATFTQRITAGVRNLFLRKWLGKLQQNLDAGVFHKFTPDELAAILSDAGFKNISTRASYGGNAILAVGRK